MDAVFPFCNSSNGDMELMYSLRCLAKNAPYIERVFIVGDKPILSLSNRVTWIKFPQVYSEPHFKQRNLVNKILCACGDMRIDRTGFLLCKDNQFLLAPVAEPHPNYHMGRKWRSGDVTESNTRDLFPDRRINNFHTHSPYIIIPAVFQSYMTTGVDWKRPAGYCIKTVYAVKAGVEGEFYPNNLKVMDGRGADAVITAGKRYFACTPFAFYYGVKDWLAERYPNKSKFEL